ncbi:hypothetical protein SEA_PEGGYLEG03_69 [Arthrobacter phage PeggyLeg03]|nr:hypothetical protein SEA_PEGGYLEG03_69 [Arthrobacter phage PeggyLeg03]
MKLVVITADGGHLTVEDFDASTLMDLLDSWSTQPYLAFALDNGMAYFASHQVTRIDAYDS